MSQPNESEFPEPVMGLVGKQLQEALKKSMASVAKEFPPKTGVVILAFDFGPGGVAYASNAVRADVLKMLHEFLDRMEKVN